MKRLGVLITTALFVLCVTAAAFAQARPNFSGNWTMDPASAPAPPAAPPAGAPAGGGGGGGGRGGGGGGGNQGFGQAFTATQNAMTLTISRMQGDQTITAVYNLNGSDSTNEVPGRQGGAPTQQVSKAVWEGNTLVITTTVNQGGNTVEQKRVLSMQGADLVVEQTNPGRQGGAPTTVKIVYKKG